MKSPISAGLLIKFMIDARFQSGPEVEEEEENNFCRLIVDVILMSVILSRFLAKDLPRMSQT